MARTIVNYSLDPVLCERIKAQSLLEDRPMSRIVTKAVTEYLAHYQETEDDRQLEDA